VSRPAYVVAPESWDRGQPNPFSADGAYGPLWSHFTLRDADDDRLIYGSGGTDLYGLAAGARCDRLHERLADFIRYESEHGRTVILSAPAGLDVGALAERCLAQTPDPSLPRPGDPRWLVHSTSAEAWREIEACGELRSSALLASLGAPVDAQGMREFGEPADYGDYVMLAELDRVGPELVVASRAAGTIVGDADSPYTPGVRLYFDASSVFAAGLAVRDGAHALKVRDRLALAPHLVCALDPGALGPASEAPVWTPRLFLDLANDHLTRVGPVALEHGRAGPPRRCAIP
jgi:hypothetical protein